MLPHVLTLTLLLPVALGTPVHEKRQPPVKDTFYISSITANPATIPWGGGVRLAGKRDTDYSPPYNGQQLVLGDNVGLSQWVIPPSMEGQIRTAGKCIDAGSYPGNGVRLKLWDCYDVPQQKWRVTGTRIELVGYNLCMDVVDGNFGPNAAVQTWQCYDGNPNQKWALRQVQSW